MRPVSWLALTTLLLAIGCKPFHAQDDSTNLKADQDAKESLEPARDLATGQPVADAAAAYRDLEVVDCPVEVCTADTELMPATPEGTNELLASTRDGKSLPGETDSAFALVGDDASSFDDVAASNTLLAQAFANGGVNGLRAVSTLVSIGNALSQIDGKSRREKLESAKSVLRSLRDLDALAERSGVLTAEMKAGLAKYRPVKTLLERFGEVTTNAQTKKFLQAASNALDFFRNNLVSSTEDGKLNILEKLLDVVPQELLEERQGSPRSLANLSDSATAALIAASRRFAGKDGFLNRGDSVRILPVVPRLVAEVADQKIAEGYAQGMAQLASEHPFVYRRWMRRPNGLIGRAVNKRVGEALSEANAEKWNAVRQAGVTTQKLFEDLMTDFGVTRYYLGLEADTEHWDPDRELSTAEIRQLVQTLTGMTVEQIAAKAMSGGGSDGLQVTAEKIKQMAGKLRYPDGIPVAEIATLLDAYRTKGEVQVPGGIDFRMGKDGKVEVVRHHDRCECYYEPQVKACIMTFKPADDATLRYFPSSLSSQGSCDYKTQCHDNFVKTGRTVNLMKACGGTFKARETGKVYIYGN